MKDMTKRAVLLLLALAVLVACAACGGGGGTSAPVDNSGGETVQTPDDGETPETPVTPPDSESEELAADALSNLGADASAAGDYEEEQWDEEEDDVAFDWADETPDISSPAPNTAVVVVDPIREVKLSVFHLGHSEVTSEGKYRFYLFKLGSDNSYWQRLVLDIDPNITAGETIMQGNWDGMSYYDAQKLSVVWSREALSDYFSGGKSSITMTANKNNGNHMEGSFEAYPASSIHDIQIYGSFNLNFGESSQAAKNLYDEVGPGSGVSSSGGGSSTDLPSNGSSSSKSEVVACTFCDTPGSGNRPGDGKCSSCHGTGHLGFKAVYGDTCRTCNGNGSCIWCGGDGIR